MFSWSACSAFWVSRRWQTGWRRSHNASGGVLAGYVGPPADQQANQVLAPGHPAVDQQWADSNLFGLGPNYGCCTANLHQGWPKLVAHLWLAAPDEGLAAAAYGPCRVTARAGRAGGHRGG